MVALDRKSVKYYLILNWMAYMIRFLNCIKDFDGANEITNKFPEDYGV